MHVAHVTYQMISHACYSCNIPDDKSCMTTERDCTSRLESARGVTDICYVYVIKVVHLRLLPER